jgi:hypothetical protein
MITRGLLNGLNWSNMIVAGGAVLSSLLPDCIVPIVPVDEIIQRRPPHNLFGLQPSDPPVTFSSSPAIKANKAAAAAAAARTAAGPTASSTSSSSSSLSLESTNNETDKAKDKLKSTSDELNTEQGRSKRARTNTVHNKDDRSDEGMYGGYVSGANGFHTTDIDIFIYGLTPSEATKKMKEILHVIKRNGGNNDDILVSPYSVTILGNYPNRHCQVCFISYVIFTFEANSDGIWFA